MARRSAEELTTISALARRHGLSRAALLHYDRIGLLKPAQTSPAGYRLYDAAASTRLARIVELRAAGMALDAVVAALAADDAGAAALRAHLQALELQIDALHRQHAIAQALLHARGDAPTRAMGKTEWTSMLRAIGVDDAAMHRWHALFEAQQPQAHRQFLLGLGLPPREVARIRAWARRFEA